MLEVISFNIKAFNINELHLFKYFSHILWRIHIQYKILNSAKNNFIQYQGLI